MVRIQCPHCATSYMVMSGVEKQSNNCPHCRRNFLPGSVAPVPPAPPWTAPAPLSAVNTAPAPPRQPALGYLMILASWVLGPGTVFAVHALSSETDWLTTLLLMLLLVGGTYSAGWLLLRGRRLVAQHAADLLGSDTRPPLLLLRSFADDELELERPPSTMFSNTVITFEEVLADVCTWYGPVIAIGRPGETLPPLGAARLWVDHHHWQQKVTELLRGCEAVVMIMGAIKGKDGLAWEIETVCKLGLQEKLILVVPPLKNEDLVKSRWQSYRRLTPGRMPTDQGGEMVVMFDRLGVCSVERQTGGGGRFIRDRKTYKRMLHAAVRRLGARPRRSFAVGLARAVRAAAFGIIVVVLFIAMTLWKNEQHRKKHEEGERWRRELSAPPPYRLLP